MPETFFQKLSRDRDTAKAALQAEADANVTALQRQVIATREAAAASVAEQDAKFEAELAEQRSFTARTEHHELKGLLADLLKQPTRSKVEVLSAWVRRVDALSFDTTGQPLDPWFVLHAMQVATIKYGEVSGAAVDAATALFNNAKAHQVTLAEGAWSRLEDAFAKHADGGPWGVTKANRVLNGALDSSGIRVIWGQVDAEQKAFETRQNAEEYARIIAAREAKTPEAPPTRSAKDIAKALGHAFAELLA